MYNQKALQYAKDKEKEIKKLHYRPSEQKNDDRANNRDDLMRDYARILYSSSFRRLQGKMQLLGVDVNKFNRNRLTHSLEVAQIARCIAHDLKLKNPIVAEAAALAHDIGNPPFGHYGEKVLNELSHSVGGYEGNAQTLRILHRLEKKHTDYQGLNLNIRTLMAVTKYPFTKCENENKFLYKEDYFFLKKELEKKGLEMKKSIDAEIMDLADEIAYAAHDLEDALSFGMISLDEIIYEFKISSDFLPAYKKIKNLGKKAKNLAKSSSTNKTSSEEYASILRKELTSKIVNTLCSDIGVVNDQLSYLNHKELAEGLKKLLFKAVLRKKDIQLYERRGELIIRGLFEVYSDNKFNKDNVLLPAELRSISSYCKTRLVTDYISGMMDHYAIQEYERYFGKGSSEKLY